MFRLHCTKKLLDRIKPEIVAPGQSDTALAMSAERVFAGTYITEVEVREKSLAWVPEVMRFACRAPEAVEPEIEAADAEPGVDGETHTPRELAA